LIAYELQVIGLTGTSTAYIIRWSLPNAARNSFPGNRTVERIPTLAMTVPAIRSDLNIQEKRKTTDKIPVPKPPNATSTAGPPPDTRVEALADTLRSSTFTGEVLRVLVRRLRHPEHAYTSKELEMLLLLTLALDRAGMWP
jgi:hypothetical protein